MRMGEARNACAQAAGPGRPDGDSRPAEGEPPQLAVHTRVLTIEAMSACRLLCQQTRMPGRQPALSPLRPQACSTGDSELVQMLI